MTLVINSFYTPALFDGARPKAFFVSSVCTRACASVRDVASAMPMVCIDGFSQNFHIKQQHYKSALVLKNSSCNVNDNLKLSACDRCAANSSELDQRAVVNSEAD